MFNASSFYGIFFASCFLGYFLGSISPAVIVGRSKGIDILKEGSGNPGATNVKRVMGSFWGNLVFGCDFLKGLVAAGWPLLLFKDQSVAQYCAMGSFVASVLGHSCSVFLKFRGGKGVATTLGGLMALMPGVVVIGGILWALCFYTTRYVSLASIIMGLSMPLSAYIWAYPPLYFYLCSVLALLILVRHRENISRLINGTEKRFAKKR